LGHPVVLRKIAAIQRQLWSYMLNNNNKYKLSIEVRALHAVICYVTTRLWVRHFTSDAAPNIGSGIFLLPLWLKWFQSPCRSMRHH